MNPAQRQLLEITEYGHLEPHWLLLTPTAAHPVDAWMAWGHWHELEWNWPTPPPAH